MDSEKKQWVRERYGEIAGGGEGCCGPSPCCGGSAADTAREIGYDPQDLAVAPEGANLGLGCGNPIAIAGIREGETVLDLGAGAGFDAFLAAARVGPFGRVIGIDMTPEMVESARRNAAEGGYANVEFRLGDIEHMPVEDDSIDLVISNCVLNLVPDKRKAFAEICRVLRPGGRLAVADLVLDGPLPPGMDSDPESYTSCISGAVPRADYMRWMREAGLQGITIDSETDAAGLLAGDCGGGEGSVPCGVVTSIRISARMPTQDQTRTPFHTEDTNVIDE